MGIVVGFILLVLSLSSAIDGAPFDSKTCIDNYLKSKGLLSDKFGNAEEVGEFCLGIIKSIETITYMEVRKNLNEEKEFRNNTECMIEELKKVDYIDYVLKSQTLGEKNPKVPEAERTNQLSKAIHMMTELSTNAVIECQFTSEFSSVFDSILNPDSNEEDLTDEEDYCVRKHILDNELIDKTKYDLKENPKALDTSTIDCETLYNLVEAKIKETMLEGMKEMDSDEDSSTQISDDCVMDVLETLKTIDRLAYMDYLPELVENVKELPEEKEKFVNMMKELTKAVMSQCSKMK